MAEKVGVNSFELFFPVVFLSLPIFFLLLKQFKTLLQPRSAPLPPGPYPWPVLGNLLQVGNKPHISLARLAQTYGPLFSLRLGNQLVVVGSSKSAAIEILKTQDRFLSGRHVPHAIPNKSLERNKFSIAWAMECNEDWKHQRALCRQELFSSKALESQERVREKVATEMVEFIRKMEGKELKMKDLVFASVFNMVSNILVSRDLISLEQESVLGGMSLVARQIAELSATPNISDLFPILSPFDLQGIRKKMVGLSDRAFEMWQEIIEERRGRTKIDSSNPIDFLDVLINNGSCDDEINIWILDTLFASGETSSLTVEWTMTELIRNRSYMKAVQEEISKEINREEKVRESHLPKLPFLQACVKESLRLHPVTPFLLPRRAVETCEVMNYTIPKDTQVLVNSWAIHRDPESWEEPLVYKPERFLNSDLDFKGNDFEYIPFGAGRRICAGLPMAVKQVPFLIASLIHFFDWSLPHGINPNEIDMSEKFTTSLKKAQPLVLVPRAKKLKQSNPHHICLADHNVS